MRERTSSELSLMKEPPPLFKSHDSSLSTHQKDGCNLELGLFCETGSIFLYSDPSTEAQTAHKHLPTPGKSKRGLRMQLRKKKIIDEFGLFHSLRVLKAHQVLL